MKVKIMIAMRVVVRIMLVIGVRTRGSTTEGNGNR